MKTFVSFTNLYPFQYDGWTAWEAKQIIDILPKPTPAPAEHRITIQHWDLSIPHFVSVKQCVSEISICFIYSAVEPEVAYGGSIQCPIDAQVRVPYYCIVNSLSDLYLFIKWHICWFIYSLIVYLMQYLSANHVDGLWIRYSLCFCGARGISPFRLSYFRKRDHRKCTIHRSILWIWSDRDQPALQASRRRL